MNKYSINDKTSYCLGMSLTIEALKHQAKYIRQVILSEKAQKNNQLDLLLSLCEENNISYIYDDKTIDKFSNKENCYCIGIFDKYYNNVNDDNHVLLYSFNDFGDLGTILRSCVSFDFKDIVLINSDIDYFDPRCIRASMGAIFHLNISKYNSIDEYKNDFNDHLIYSFVSSCENELSDMYLVEPFSLIIGQDYYSLDNMKENSYYLKHNNDSEISLSIRSSIILQKAYELKRNL